MAELSVEDIVRINVSITPTGLTRKQTGITLFVTTTAGVISTAERVRTYASFAEVQADWGPTTEPYKAAQVYFSQDPYPRNLMIGVEGVDASAGKLYCGTDVLGYLPAWNLKETGSFQFSVDGGALVFVDDMDFRTVANGYDIENVINARLTELAIGATCEWNGSRFILTSNTAGTSSSVSFMTEIQSPNDVAGLMQGRDGDNGAYIDQGDSTEGMIDALLAIVDIDPDFTFITLDETLTDTSAVEDTAAFCSARGVYILSAETHQANVLSASTGTFFDDLYQGQYSNAFGTYSQLSEYKAVSAAARLSSVNFDQSNSLITLMFKKLPTCTADSMSTTQVQNLRSKNVNAYVSRSGIDMYENGHTFNDDWWVDARYWTVWFQNALETSVFNLLYSAGKIPQTETGIASIVSVVEGVCDEGVKNGGIAGGVLSAALTNDVRESTGNTSFDGVLANGYLVYAEPLATQDQAIRATRVAPPIKIWLKGSGAIQSVEIAVVIEQ